MPLRYELRRERHAIGEFTATLQFFQAISAPTFADVARKLTALAESLNLPAPVPIQVMAAVGQQSSPGVTQTTTQMGMGFQRFAANGEVETSLICDGDEIAFTSRDYTTWEEMKPAVLRVFVDLSAPYVSEVPAIKSLRLQYTNEFLSIKPDVHRPTEIFKPKSQWIAPFAYSLDQAWHCHVGRYFPIDDNQRMLVNVNCNVAKVKRQETDDLHSYVSVVLLSGCFFNVAGGRPLIVTEEDTEHALDQLLEDAHVLEKKILAETISERYLAAMGVPSVLD